MVLVRKALRNMENYLVGCGPVGASQPDEVVSITWVDEDKAFNIGYETGGYIHRTNTRYSVQDQECARWEGYGWYQQLEDPFGARHDTGQVSQQHAFWFRMCFFRCLIRWTEVFLINTGDKGTPTHGENLL